MKSNSFSLFDFNPDSRKHIKNNNKKETATCPSSKYHPYPTPEWKFSARIIRKTTRTIFQNETVRFSSDCQNEMVRFELKFNSIETVFDYRFNAIKF